MRRRYDHRHPVGMGKKAIGCNKSLRPGPFSAGVCYAHLRRLVLPM